jgi:hypothetical protein
MMAHVHLIGIVFKPPWPDLDLVAVEDKVVAGHRRRPVVWVLEPDQEWLGEVVGDGDVVLEHAERGGDGAHHGSQSILRWLPLKPRIRREGEERRGLSVHLRRRRDHHEHLPWPREVVEARHGDDSRGRDNGSRRRSCPGACRGRSSGGSRRLYCTSTRRSWVGRDQFIYRLQKENKQREKERNEAQTVLRLKEEELAQVRAKLRLIEGQDAAAKEKEINLKVIEKTKILKSELQMMEEKMIRQQQELHALKQRLHEVDSEKLGVGTVITCRRSAHSVRCEGDKGGYLPAGPDMEGYVGNRLSHQCRGARRCCETVWILRAPGHCL